MQGAKLKNITDLTNNLEMTLGLDGSIRNWDGTYYKNGSEMLWPGTSPYPGIVKKSIDDVDTTNVALFAEFDQQLASLEIKYGLRYDDTRIKPANTDVPPLPEQQDNHYQALSANIFANYKANENLSFFGGVGKSSRVPDARELYFKSSMGTIVGTPDLDQTTNYEADLGMENRYESFTLKTKLFYSMLKDYIYFQKGLSANNFQNIDATIYGFAITGSYYALDDLYFDFGLSYQRGKKAEALAGQTNTNLAEIPPLKGNVALNYVYYKESTATVEYVGAARWRNYDSDNGEQEIGSWGIVNLKVDHKLPYGFGLAVGVDNIMNKTYAVSNTYSDLTLLTGGDDIMLMNEPGRYYYVNASYQF
jgi:iron complex outermembrane receptor protein